MGYVIGIAAWIGGATRASDHEHICQHFHDNAKDLIAGGDGDTLLPDLGGSDCDSADILAGYATSPVTKQPPRTRDTQTEGGKAHCVMLPYQSLVHRQ